MLPILVTSAVKSSKATRAKSELSWIISSSLRARESFSPSAKTFATLFCEYPVASVVTAQKPWVADVTAAVTASNGERLTFPNCWGPINIKCPLWSERSLTPNNHIAQWREIVEWRAANPFRPYHRRRRTEDLSPARLV